MNQQIFQATVFVHKDKLFRLAKRMLVSQDEAYDTVQDVMVKLWQMRDDLGKYKNLEAFCMQCIKNECYNRLKHVEVVENYRQGIFIRTNTELNSGDNTKEVILELINALPPKQKMAIHLKDVEEYELSEIAEIMEMEENAIRINLMRARQKIKVQLEKLFEYEQRQI
jgi:RNA polymerase sigma factor (sigma-70 family)